METLLLLLLLLGVGYYIYKKKSKVNAPKKKSEGFKIGSDYSFGKGIPEIDALAASTFTYIARGSDEVFDHTTKVEA